MTRIDFAPLFRSTVGFDRMAQLMDTAARFAEPPTGYPPYNIEKTGEDAFRITLAVAGFAPDDLSIEVRENVLYVRSAVDKDAEGGEQFLYRGIAGRNFERRFALADHVKVVDAALDNGLLTISLVRELPEAMRPRQIEIATGAPKAVESGTKRIETAKQAA
jgi:molecular chaperone IbpA